MSSICRADNMFIWGGYVGVEPYTIYNDCYALSLDRGLEAWTPVEQDGDVPSPRHASGTKIAESCGKVLLFGGHTYFPDGSNEYYNDLYSAAIAEDNCPDVMNPDQLDAGDDGVGDACDYCTDTDGDGYGDPGYPVNDCPTDNCPDIASLNQLDADNDGIGDICDYCTDTDGDAFGNPGYPINECSVDNCPDIANAGQENCDGDSLGNACDLDDDNDALPDDQEALEGTDPCNPDTDGDGVLDGPDQCKLEDATGLDADSNGCIDNVYDLADIINTLPDDVLSDETKNSLVVKVEAAENSIDKEKDQAAINQLSAFINEVDAKRGSKISDEVADMLIAFAQNIIAQIQAS